MKPFLRNAMAPDPDDPEWVLAFAEQLQAMPEGLCESRLRALADLGALARLQTNYALSIRYFQIAVAEAEQLALPLFIVANRIRLGLSYHYADDFEQAGACFRLALAESREYPAATVYQDFALQHLGKLWVEQNLLVEAQVCFEEALILREAKGLPDLIDSTRQALEALAKYRAREL